ncbi:Uncharacterized protein APZ42_015449 [Daphnia magna]|uniref:Uncharacterized protein n=1 Tax=Daphnia magna TaxID=35525 RepID=A0A162PHF6_9CRUS|nr:Uncharacterized protein APZ42_015449 [Daphnia magna]
MGSNDDRYNPRFKNKKSASNSIDNIDAPMSNRALNLNPMKNLGTSACATSADACWFLPSR